MDGRRGIATAPLHSRRSTSRRVLLPFSPPDLLFADARHFVESPLLISGTFLNT